MANKWKNAAEFRKDTLGKKYDVDKVAGVQCVDYFKEFTKGQCGKVLATGNGKATGYWLKTKKQVVALGFKAISKASDLKAGDWLIAKETKAQPYGHIGNIKKIVSRGKTVELQGQNQGGKGGAVNVISYPLTNFLGAFRYEKWPKDTKTEKKDRLAVGDKVKLKNLVDYYGWKLIKTRPFYYVSAIDGDRVLLRADNAKNGVVYATIKKNNLEEVK